MEQLPTGTVTFLFSDIEGSTRLLRELGDDYPTLLEAHAVRIRDAISAADGIEVSTEGDSFFAVFSTADQAITAATHAQRSLAVATWPHGVSVRVRMGIHTGKGTTGGDNYVGLDVHRAARIMQAAHGGQVVVSATTTELVTQQLPDGSTLRDLGHHRLKDLEHEEHLFQLVVEGLPEGFPPLRSVGSFRNNLPPAITTFVGRGREVAEITQLLEHNHLVTLTGPGGTGKTRLALEVANGLAEDFADGVCFVPLGAIIDVDLVPSAILAALGVHDPGRHAPSDLLSEYLSKRELLLVLDNLEQIPDVGLAVATHLPSAQRCRLLLTSRSALRIAGEQEYAVPPLALPSSEQWTSVTDLAANEAVDLFVTRAQSVSPGFSLSDANAASVAELVTRLDGLALAIELAAPRVRVLSPDALLSRLGNRILAGGARDLPARQQTINDTIAWSYDLLNETQRALADQFSVFAGGAMLTEAETVCKDVSDDVLGGLDDLVANSIVTLGEVEGESRFSMLATIREFAHDRLEVSGNDGSARKNHANAFLTLAEEAEDYLLTRDGGKWLNRLELDVDNLRAAVKFAIDDGDADLALRLAGSLYRFLQMRAHLYEATEIIDGALALPGGDPALRSKALVAAAGVAYWRGDMVRCRQANEDNLAICRQLGDERLLADALYSASFPHSLTGEFEAAEDTLKEALHLYRGLGDSRGPADVHWGFGDVAYNRRDLDQARFYFETAVSLYAELDNVFGLGWSHYMLGKTLIILGDVVGAKEHFEQGLGLFAEVGDISAFPLYLIDLAGIALRTGQHVRAATMVGALTHLTEKTGLKLMDMYSEWVPELDSARIDRLKSEYSHDFDAGAAMSPAEAAEYALK